MMYIYLAKVGKSGRLVGLSSVLSELARGCLVSSWECSSACLVCLCVCPSVRYGRCPFASIYEAHQNLPRFLRARGAIGSGAQHVAEGGDDQEPLRRGDGPGAVRANPAPSAHGREPGVAAYMGLAAYPPPPRLCAGRSVSAPFGARVSCGRGCLLRCYIRQQCCGVVKYLTGFVFFCDVLHRSRLPSFPCPTCLPHALFLRLLHPKYALLLC